MKPIVPTTGLQHWPPRLRPGQAAAYLGLSRRYVQQLSAEGRLPYHRIGKRCVVYARTDLDAFLAACRVDAAGTPGRA